MKWRYGTQNRSKGGWLRIIATPPYGQAVDITKIRGVPVILQNYSTADPFGYAGAHIDFPQMTGFDEVGTGDLSWLDRATKIDIYRVTDGTFANAQLVWQGQPINYAMDQSSQGDTFGMDCVGALYQADGYKAQPQFPLQPWSYERLIAQGFDLSVRPHMKTAPLQIQWPSGWSKVFTTAMAEQPTVYVPYGLKVGAKYTGYFTRNTGAWDNWLTSFVQNLLAVMWTDSVSGVAAGNQWTLMCLPGRIPILKVRDRFAAPTMTVRYGTPGIQLSGMLHDFSQTSDIMYGQGTDLSGENWRNATMTADGSLTGYVPMITDDTVWPPTNNKFLDTTKIIRERMVNFTPGVSQLEATDAAGQMAAMDRDPGWTGTITFASDVYDMASELVIPKATIAAGMSILVKGFAGSGEAGTLFYITETTASPQDGTVTATVDTKFRDAVSVEEVRARVRDPLIPSKLLQVNQRSITIEDQMAPWDYTAGSGIMPRESLKKSFFADLANDDPPPWADQALRYPPRAYPEHYIRVDATASNLNDRWAFFPILMSEKGTAAEIDFNAYNSDGTLAKVRFHLSLYYTNVNIENMPYDVNGNHNPFTPDAFQTTTPNGDPMPADNPLAPDQAMIIGWGNSDEPAGFSPGSYADGNHVTGRLNDASTWTWDCTNNPMFDLYAKKGTKQPQSAYTIYGAVYADLEATDSYIQSGQSHVYFTGRIYRQTPGT